MVCWGLGDEIIKTSPNLYKRGENVIKSKRNGCTGFYLTCDDGAGDLIYNTRYHCAKDVVRGISVAEIEPFLWYLFIC